MKIARHELLIKLTELLNKMIKTIQKPLAVQISEAATRKQVLEIYLLVAKGFLMQTGRSLDIFAVANFARLGVILLKEVPAQSRPETEAMLKSVIKLRMSKNNSTQWTYEESDREIELHTP